MLGLNSPSSVFETTSTIIVYVLEGLYFATSSFTARYVPLATPVKNIFSFKVYPPCRNIYLSIKLTNVLPSNFTSSKYPLLVASTVVNPLSVVTVDTVLSSNFLILSNSLVVSFISLSSLALREVSPSRASITSASCCCEDVSALNLVSTSFILFDTVLVISDLATSISDILVSTLVFILATKLSLALSISDILLSTLVFILDIKLSLVVSNSTIFSSTSLTLFSNIFCLEVSFFSLAFSLAFLVFSLDILSTSFDTLLSSCDFLFNSLDFLSSSLTFAVLV